MNKLDWDRLFSEAHLNSGPGRPSLCVSNRSPDPDHGSRNVFEEDERSIMTAAAKHGYTLLFVPSEKSPRFRAGLKGSPVYSFVKLDRTPFVPVLNTAEAQDPEWYRASGDCVCERCGKKYYDHPRFKGMPSYDGSFPLRQTCDGRLWKL